MKILCTLYRNNSKTISLNTFNIEKVSTINVQYTFAQNILKFIPNQYIHAIFLTLSVAL